MGFPYIFRGALDVRARQINQAMKLAAVRALAALAREDVPDIVLSAYGLESLSFGPLYIVPKQFDPRALVRMAPAVAQAAMETGVARVNVDIDEYRRSLEGRFGRGFQIMNRLMERAKSAPKRVVFAEGEEPKILRAAAQLVDQGIAEPIVLGAGGHHGAGGQPRPALRADGDRSDAVGPGRAVRRDPGEEARAQGHDVPARARADDHARTTSA